VRHECDTSSPEACRNVAFLLPHGISINRRGRELGMAQPALHEIERNPLFNTGDAKPMPESFGGRLRTGDASRRYHLNDTRIDLLSLLFCARLHHITYCYYNRFLPTPRIDRAM